MKPKMRTYGHALFELQRDVYPTCNRPGCHRIARYHAQYEGREKDTLIMVREALCQKHAKEFAVRYALTMPDAVPMAKTQIGR